MIRIVKVTGNSLSPFFLPGDFVLIHTRKRALVRIKAGDIVVFDHPAYGQMIKKVLSNDTETKQLEVGGTHPDSLGSEKLGKIPYIDLSGKVICQIKTPR